MGWRSTIFASVVAAWPSSMADGSNVPDIPDVPEDAINIVPDSVDVPEEQVVEAEPAGPTEADFANDPWHKIAGTLAFQKSDGGWKEFCNASVLGPSVISTAYHCAVAVPNSRMDFSEIAFITKNQITGENEFYMLAEGDRTEPAHQDISYLSDAQRSELILHQEFWDDKYNAFDDATLLYLSEPVERASYPVIAGSGDLVWETETIGKTDFEKLGVRLYAYQLKNELLSKKDNEGCALYRRPDMPSIAFSDCYAKSGMSGASYFAEVNGELVYVAKHSSGYPATDKNFMSAPFTRYFVDLEFLKSPIDSEISSGPLADGLVTYCQQKDWCDLPNLDQVTFAVPEASEPERMCREVTVTDLALRSGAGTSNGLNGNRLNPNDLVVTFGDVVEGLGDNITWAKVEVLGDGREGWVAQRKGSTNYLGAPSICPQ